MNPYNDLEIFGTCMIVLAVIIGLLCLAYDGYLITQKDKKNPSKDENK